MKLEIRNKKTLFLQYRQKKKSWMPVISNMNLLKLSSRASSKLMQSQSDCVNYLIVYKIE